MQFCKESSNNLISIEMLFIATKFKLCNTPKNFFNSFNKIVLEK